MIPHAEGALVQANLSQVFIACTSQVGAGDGVELLGSSVVADPYGRIAGGPLSTVREQLEIVDIVLVRGPAGPRPEASSSGPAPTAAPTCTASSTRASRCKRHFLVREMCTECTEPTRDLIEAARGMSVDFET